MTRKPPQPRIKLRSIYLWHRYIGVVVALLVLLLSVTGIMLNHTESLRLDNRYLTSATLLNWYGVGESGPIKNIVTGDYHVSQRAQRLYIDAKPVAGETTSLQGAVAIDDLLIVALTDRVLLLSAEAELVDQFPSPVDQANSIKNIGLTLTDSLPVLQTVSGYFKANAQLTHWRPLAMAPAQVQWSTAQAPVTRIQSAIDDYERAHVLDMERFILDLHSGRIFGNAGVWIMDAAAALMMLLSVSGLFLWLNQRQKRKQHQRRF